MDGPAEHSAALFVRLATIDDGHSIGEVHAAAWQLGFGHMLGGEFLERASAGGTGIADALMHETCAVLSTRARRAVLWTPYEAHRARRFYERCGFERTGRTRSEPLSDWQPTPTYEEVAAVEYALSLS